jgi:predicted RNase H-like HicB family nuclease
MPTINDVPLGQMVNLKDKVAIVYDNGLFIEIAKTLAKSFKKVYYYMPWKNGFPKSNQYIVGQGIEGIERIHDFWKYKDKADIIIFPDIYDGDLQLELVKQGKLVWGGRMGEEMELYREKMKRYMKSVGLFVTPFTVIKGLDALREYLKDNDNVWIKQNVTRGDFETFHSKNYQIIEPVLDELEHKLGKGKLLKEFIVEQALDDAVETGVDLYTVDGNYPSETLAGIEVKDLGYVGKIVSYAELSPKVTDFNDKIKDALKQYGYRGFMSTEIRVSKNKPPYMVDFCARAGSPPNELYQLMYKNLAEIIWYGASGILIDPVTTKKYGIEVLIHSSWADQNWQAITFPAKYRDNIKLRNAVRINGLYYAVPQAVGLPEIGAVVTEADTMEEAVEKAKEIAESIQGHYIEVKIDSINVALEQFKKLEEFGVKIL